MNTALQRFQELQAEWIEQGKRLGEYAAAFRKGSHICVEGELRSREYESKAPRGEEGRRADREITKVRTYDIVASSIINLRGGQRGDGSAATGDAQMSDAQAPDPVEAAA